LRLVGLGVLFCALGFVDGLFTLFALFFLLSDPLLALHCLFHLLPFNMPLPHLRHIQIGHYRTQANAVNSTILALAMTSFPLLRGCWFVCSILCCIGIGCVSLGLQCGRNVPAGYGEHVWQWRGWNASIAGGVWSWKEITLISGQMYIRKRINGLRDFRRVC